MIYRRRDLQEQRFSHIMSINRFTVSRLSAPYIAFNQVTERIQRKDIAYGLSVCLSTRSRDKTTCMQMFIHTDAPWTILQANKPLTYSTSITMFYSSDFLINFVGTLDAENFCAFQLRKFKILRIFSSGMFQLFNKHQILTQSPHSREHKMNYKFFIFCPGKVCGLCKEEQHCNPRLVEYCIWGFSLMGQQRNETLTYL